MYTPTPLDKIEQADVLLMKVRSLITSAESVMSDSYERDFDPLMDSLTALENGIGDFMIRLRKEGE